MSSYLCRCPLASQSLRPSRWIDTRAMWGHLLIFRLIVPKNIHVNHWFGGGGGGMVCGWLVSTCLGTTPYSFLDSRCAELAGHNYLPYDHNLEVLSILKCTPDRVLTFVFSSLQPELHVSCIDHRSLLAVAVLHTHCRLMQKI